ncbi:MAG: energy transducer TonB [Cyclobacteriaceae bacterium]|nr:energy transducer TonB [Cyclobacteriaceae bacterium]
MGLFHEPKKTSKADLEKIRPLLFNLSLVITLLLIIAAFEWESSTMDAKKTVVVDKSDFDEIIDVPQTEIPPPPPPQVIQQPRIVEVPDQEEIEEEINVQFDIDVTDQSVSQEFKIETQVVVEEEETDKIFLVVEQPASPKGGMSAFYEFVSRNIKYPAQARRLGTEGKVFVEFIVEKDGSLSSFTVIKGIGAGCDEEAVRILQLSPPWTPGKQRGQPVKQRMVLPIHFKMAQRA